VYPKPRAMQLAKAAKAVVPAIAVDVADVNALKTAPIVAITPDEKEIWLADAANSRVHVFDATVMPPRQVASIALRDQPGWVTFSLDGRHGYPSTGEVIDTATRKVVATLTDEEGRAVQSEKLLEIVFADGKPVRVSDQFGVGRKR